MTSTAIDGADLLERQEYRGPLSIVGVAALLLQWRKPLIILPLTFVIVVFAVTISQARTYSSSAGFIPQSSGLAASRLAGFAAQFGFAVPQGDNTNSPAFYSELSHSRSLLDRLAKASYSARAGDAVRQESLASLFGITAKDSLAQRDELIKRLSNAISVSTTKETDIVRLTVTTERAELSQQLAAQLLEQLNDVNLSLRRSQATAQGEFVEERLASSRADLRAADQALTTFLERNRQFASDPQLSAEHDRLQREMAVRQQLFTSLAQAFAQARFDALRDTPVIVVVDHPEVAARADPRGLWYKLPLAALIGLGVALFAVVVITSWREAEARDPSAAARVHAYMHRAR